MSRKSSGRMNGERYLGNKNKFEVHDLDNECADCKINDILSSENEVPFSSLQFADDLGFDRCPFCLGGLKR